MKKITTLSALLGLTLMVGCGSIRELGEIKGKKIYKITTRDLLAPSTTSVVDEDLNPVNVAAGPGAIPATATAGGIAAGAYLLRPAKSETNVGVRNSASGTGNGGSGGQGGTGGVGNGGTGGNGQFVPPGHVNNPSENH